MTPPSPLLVQVTVSGWLLALPAAAIAELVHEPALVQPPNMPAVLAGLLNLRGQVVPVLRPDVLLNLPPPPPGPFRVLLVFHGTSGESPGLVWALLVERAMAVIVADTLEPVPPGHSLGDCVVALLPGAEAPVPVLDPGRLMRRSEALALAEFAEREGQRWGEFRRGDA